MADQYSPEYPQQIAEQEAGPGPAPSSSRVYGSKLKRGEAKTLKRRLEVAQKYRDKVFIPWWEEVHKWYDGDQWDGLKPNDHRAVINILPHIVETQVYSTAFKMGEVIVKPMDPVGEENAPTAERAVHYSLREAHALRECRRAYKDSRLLNFGVLMDGWAFETDEVCLTDTRLPVENEAPEPEAVLRAVEEGKDLPPPVPRARVRKDNFYTKRLDPRNFLVSPEGSWVLEEMPWCGYEEIRELSEVKADPRYKNTQQIKGSAKHLEGYYKKDGDDKTPQGDVEPPPDLKRVKLLHYYEWKRRLHVVFCDEHDSPLLVEEWGWEHDRYPFRLVFDEPGERGFYQKPRLLDWKHMQREINYFHTQLSIHIRRFVRRYVARAGDFDEKALKQLQSGVDGTVVFTKAQDPAGALVPVQDAQLSPDVYNAEQKVMQYLSVISGLDQYEMGRPPTKRMTQTEVQQVEQSGGARQQAARESFEELCAGVAEDCLAWLQQNAIRTRTFPVMRDGQVVEWKDWTRDEIAGRFSLEVYVGSTEIKNRATRAEEIGFLLQALTPFFGMPDPADPTGMTPIANPKELLRQFLLDMPDLVKDVAAIVPESAPAPGPEEMLMDPMLGGDPMQELAALGAGAPPMEEAPMGLGGF